MSKAMAQRHRVWVITRESNRAAIQNAIARDPEPNLHFAYYDLPRWARWWKRGERGVRLYYYLWQVGALSVARRLTAEVRFDLAHHLTFAKYWAPSFLAFLDIPFVWGPLGGGESAPWELWKDLSRRGQVYEVIRTTARWISEHDPLILRAARRARVAVAATPATAERLRRLGASCVREFSQVGLSSAELELLGGGSPRENARVRFVSMGRLHTWKGFHWGLRAFAQADLPGSEYWIIGHGPDRPYLERLAAVLGITHRVRFFGHCPHVEALHRLRECDVLVHPSIHESGGGACLEAMGSGVAVICLDLGGPALQLTPETGLKVAPGTPVQVVRDIAQAMRRLAEDAPLRDLIRTAARKRAYAEYTWTRRAERLNAIYLEACREGASTRVE